MFKRDECKSFFRKVSLKSWAPTVYGNLYKIVTNVRVKNYKISMSKHRRKFA